MKLLYGIEEAAELLSLSKHTLGRDIRRGLIEVRRYGRRVLIPHSELIRLAGSSKSVSKDVDIDRPGPRAA